MVSLAPDLVQVLVPARARVVHLVMEGVLLVVILVVFLGGIKVCVLLDGHDDRLVVAAGLVKVLPGFFSHLLLFGVVVENARPVMRPPVHELAVGVGGVDLFPKHVHQLGVGDLGRIVDDLNALGVSLVAVVLIGGVGAGTVGVTGDDLQDAPQLLEGRGHAPKTTAREGGGVGLGFGFGGRAHGHHYKKTRQKFPE